VTAVGDRRAAPTHGLPARSPAGRTEAVPEVPDGPAVESRRSRVWSAVAHVYPYACRHRQIAYETPHVKMNRPTMT
jgi:hypothetical protein